MFDFTLADLWRGAMLLTVGLATYFGSVNGAKRAMQVEFAWLRADLDDCRTRVTNLEKLHMKSLGRISVGLVAALALAAAALSIYSPSSVAAAGGGEPRPLYGSATYDLTSLVDGAGASTTVTVSGAALGDFCGASLGVSTQGILVTCSVTAANTATVRFQNETTGTLDLASSTLRVRVNRVPAGG